MNNMSTPRLLWTIWCMVWSLIWFLIFAIIVQWPVGYLYGAVSVALIWAPEFGHWVMSGLIGNGKETETPEEAERMWDVSRDGRDYPERHIPSTPEKM